MTLFYYGDFSNYAGIENYGYNLITLLKKAHPEIDIVVLSETNRCVYETEFKKMGCKVINLSFNLLKPLQFSKRLKKALEFASKEDVIQLNVCSMRNFALFNVCKKTKMKTIVVSHYSKPKGKFKILHYICRSIYKNKFINVSVSHEAGQFMFGNAKYSIIPNYVDVKPYGFSIEGRKEIRTLLNINENDKLLGLVGRLSKEKNQSFAIDILNEIDDFSIKLVFLGEGNNDLLKKRIKQGLKNNIFFYSSKPENIYKWYSAFDLLLIPSKHESFSLVKYEAITNGLDIFVSNHVPRASFEPNTVKYLDLNIKKWSKEIQIFSQNYIFSFRDNKKTLETISENDFVSKYIDIYNS